MTAVRKTILVGREQHHVHVDSSLNLQEIEITGVDPATGKTVHVSLSSLMEAPRAQAPEAIVASPAKEEGMSMFEDMPSPEPVAQAPAKMSESSQTSESSQSGDDGADLVKDLFD